MRALIVLQSMPTVISTTIGFAAVSAPRRERHARSEVASSPRVSGNWRRGRGSDVDAVDGARCNLAPTGEGTRTHAVVFQPAHRRTAEDNVLHRRMLQARGSSSPQPHHARLPGE